jgi:uncharacterized protein DUF6642
MKRRIRKRNGIFCIEGEWYGNLRKPTSIEGALTLLKTPQVSDIPYIHRNLATSAELEHYILKWTQKQLDAFPLLYVGLHGTRGGILVGDARRKDAQISLNDLRSVIRRGKLGKRRRIVYFGSCGTLALHGNAVQNFLRDTGLFAVFGYSKTNVDWMESAVFETVLLYNVLHISSFTEKRILEAISRTKRDTGGLSGKLGFRLFIRKTAPRALGSTPSRRVNSRPPR